MRFWASWAWKAARLRATWAASRSLCRASKPLRMWAVAASPRVRCRWQPRWLPVQRRFSSSAICSGRRRDLPYFSAMNSRSSDSEREVLRSSRSSGISLPPSSGWGCSARPRPKGRSFVLARLRCSVCFRKGRFQGWCSFARSCARIWNHLRSRRCISATRASVSRSGENSSSSRSARS